MAATVETKLYVTNFPSSATRQQLQQFFSRFGRVQECAIMWNSYAFVHYATMEEARRALDQSNGAMFLNRKLIVQLSTSRFRPQPKENNPSASQMMLMNPASYHHSIGGSNAQQPSTSLSPPFAYSDLMTSNNLRSQSPPPPPPPLPDNSPNYSSLPQDITHFYSTFSSTANKLNHMKLMKTLKADIGMHGELPKLYCTNLPENCKAHDLQRLFSTFGQVTDCVILWDYYAFVTYKSFGEAEQALKALNGFTWKDRHLIVEWSRASGRRQQQQTPPTPPRLVGMFNENERLHSMAGDLSISHSPRVRPSSLVTASNNHFYETKSPTLNQNLNLISMMQSSYLPSLTKDNHQLFHSLTNSSPNHRLDLSSYIDNNSNPLFSPSSELNTPSSAASVSNVYQPSDIIAFLEPSSSDLPVNNKSTINDITNTFSSTFNQVPPSCSSAAAAGAAALSHENLLPSLFNSFEPFNNDPSSSSRYNHLSPLLTTAPDTNHYPISYSHNISWH